MTKDSAATEMRLIHRIFRKQFAEVASLVRTVELMSPTRAGAVAGHLEFLLEGLHMHHTTEDELVWPTLASRLGDEGTLAAMEQQHEAIAASVARVRSATEAWRRSPDRSTAGSLSHEVDAFRVVLEAHLDQEERDAVPLIVRHLTPEEWEAVGQTAFAKFTPEQRWIATGQLLDVATPDEAATMFGALPVQVRILWHVVGKRTYRRYITPVRGAGS